MAVPLLLAGIVFFCSGLPGAGQEAATGHRIKLNKAGFDHVRQLINRGVFIDDRKGSWSEHRPTAAAENEFIRRYGFASYAKWHLGIDESHPEKTKARYKFPVGDFHQVHRCALLAAQSRARQYGHREVALATAELIRSMERKAP